MPIRNLIFISSLAFTAISFANSSQFGSGFGQKWIEKIQIVRKTKIWTEPTKFGEPIAELEPGVELELISYSTSGAWARVSTPKGREGYVLVRHTNLSGRRGDGPLNPGDQDAINSARLDDPMSKNREIASVQDRTLSFFDTGLNLGYGNQINRSFASGFTTGIYLDFRVATQWTLGLAYDYGYFSDSAADLLANAQTQRKSHRHFPHARVRYAESAFDFVLGIGLDIDSTNFNTQNLTTGQVITQNDAGQLVTGSERNSTLGLKIEPKYWFPIGSQSYMGLYSALQLTVNFGDGAGSFAGAPTNQVVAQFDLGLCFSKGF